MWEEEEAVVEGGERLRFACLLVLLYKSRDEVSKVVISFLNVYVCPVPRVNMDKLNTTGGWV